MKKFMVVCMVDGLAVGVGEEVTTEYDLSFLYLKGKPKMDKYFMVHNQSILSDKDMTGNDIRVFYKLCEKMSGGGWLDCTQELIAQELGISVTTVSTCVKRLKAKEKKYISEKKEKRTGRKKLRVNDSVASKGSLAYRNTEEYRVQEEFEDYLPEPK